MEKDKSTKPLESLTIFIPFYNEEESIPGLAKRLIPVVRQLQVKWQVQLVMVDDGSSDKTHQSLLHYFTGLPFIQTTVLQHTQNRGIGGAMQTAFMAATGDLICTLDSDCTYAPEKLPEMLDMMLRENADIITGSPYHPLGRVENVDSRRLLLSKTASIMYSFLVPTKLHCYTSFFRIYRREWARTEFFRSSGFLAVTEILISAASEGARVVEFPVSMGSRAAGRSKMKVAKVTFDHLQLMSKTAVHNMVFTSGRKTNTRLLTLAPASVDGDLFLQDWVLVGKAQYSPGGSIRKKILPSV